jgi:hypothetical protein
MKKKITPTEYFVVFYLVFMTFQYVVEYYFREGYQIANIIFRVMVLLGILFPFIIMLCGLKPKFNNYRVYFLWVFATNVILTVIFLTFGYGRFISNVAIYFGMLTGFFISILNLEILEKALKKIAIIGLLVFPLIFLLNDFNIGVALRRGYTWTSTFFYAGFYWAVIPLVILAFIKKSNIKLGILYWTAAVIVNMIFVKRAIIIDSMLLLGVMLLVIGLTEKNKFKELLKLSTYILMIIIISMIFFDDMIIELYNAIILRFTRSASDISSFDRFSESITYFKNSGILENIVGKGFLGTHMGLGKEADALHVGWTNFIFKGGLLLFLVVIIPYGRIFSLIRKFKHLPDKIKFSVLMLLVYSIKLFYSNMHSFLPEMVIFFYCLFTIMDFNKVKYFGMRNKL